MLNYAKLLTDLRTKLQRQINNVQATKDHISALEAQEQAELRHQASGKDRAAGSAK